VRELPIASIRPHPDQPRRTFDGEELQRLAQSMAVHGQLQPIIVVEAEEGYILVAGERRLRAAKLAGRDTIFAVVRTANDQERLEVALVENIQRADLNAVEEALAYQHLIDAFGLTQERIAERVGRSRPTIANTLRILATAPDVQEAVMGARISAGHARALAGLDSHAQQSAVLAAVVSRSLSVRQTESLVASTRDEVSALQVREAPRVDPDVAVMEARVREALGTKVTITAGRAGGRITITWYDDEDLERIVDRLSGMDR
jgi:ParB family chromosome partitioning protein